MKEPFQDYIFNLSELFYNYNLFSFQMFCGKIVKVKLTQIKKLLNLMYMIEVYNIWRYS